MSLTSPVRVWDIPTRLFHWLVVGLVGFSWGAAEYGKMDLHRLSGSILLGLVAFRLIWGLIGSNTARFGSFLRSPAAEASTRHGRSGARPMVEADTWLASCLRTARQGGSTMGTGDPVVLRYTRYNGTAKVAGRSRPLAGSRDSRSAGTSIQVAGACWEKAASTMAPAISKGRMVVSGDGVEGERRCR